MIFYIRLLIQLWRLWAQKNSVDLPQENDYHSFYSITYFSLLLYPTVN